MKDIELPPLPRRSLCEFDGAVEIDLYTKEQMQSYARAAVEADRAQRVPDEQAIRAALRSALAWGRVYGEVIPAHQWDDMREAQIEQAIQLLASTPAKPAQQTLPEAMETVIAEMQSDPDYAWSWHCNVAMAMVDAGCDPVKANQGAARFMRVLANVEPAHELPSATTQHQEPPQPVERKPMVDPCPGCTKGHVCRTPKCGRLALPVDHPLRCPTPGIRE